MFRRFKRNRVNQQVRDLVSDVYLSKKDLIYPIFITEEENVYAEIASMPNQYHYSIDKLHIIVDKLKDAKVDKVLLFGIPNHKDGIGTSAYDNNGIIQKGTRKLKELNPNLFIITDVCMCEYTDHGHCGILDDHNVIDNDKTIEVLAKIALSHVEAGSDMIAPSDMADGRVQAIRNNLDEHGYKYIPIMSYSAKYASSYYGPFRDAAGSAPSFGDRKYYQMDYRNTHLGVDEALNDIDEGADIVIVKPALVYLDIVAKIKSSVNIPVCVYNVSGEYAMVETAASAGLIDKKGIVMETMYAFKRAGASMIITYFALDVAKYLDEE
ncbi:porphobilinogen synthase [Mycoplasma sp. P36-A1]|uniref:porphobilinogen synthase n=1 Tax=Mycoplasma sp. P36-A1 TaxID=3252900 RepID=UPI003C2E3FC1